MTAALRIACALATAAALLGCARAPQRPALPTLIRYTAQDQAALAAEPKGPQTRRWIGDYIGLRDQVRAAAAIPSRP